MLLEHICLMNRYLIFFQLCFKLFVTSLVAISVVVDFTVDCRKTMLSVDVDFMIILCKLAH